MVNSEAISIGSRKVLLCKSKSQFNNYTKFYFYKPVSEQIVHTECSVAKYDLNMANFRQTIIAEAFQNQKYTLCSLIRFFQVSPKKFHSFFVSKYKAIHN